MRSGQKLTAPPHKVNQLSARDVAHESGRLRQARSACHRDGPIPPGYVAGGTCLVRPLPVLPASAWNRRIAGMSVLAWIILGLIAGAIAKAIMPGDDPGGVIVTILIGIVGAFLGGFLGNMVAGSGINGFSAWSVLLAVVGAIILLWIYRVATRRRAKPINR
jgi:uncharacterized membrane protein YeaQ/YmgE (transglycosylase-associated protein family)